MGAASPSSPWRAVGSLDTSSETGAKDMFGGVAEWCLDYWNDGRPPAGDRNPTGPKTGRQRVVRGGAWCLPPARCNLTTAAGFASRDASTGIGFRVACGAPRPGADEPPQAWQQCLLRLPEAVQSVVKTQRLASLSEGDVTASGGVGLVDDALDRSMDFL